MAPCSETATPQTGSVEVLGLGLGRCRVQWRSSSVALFERTFLLAPQTSW
jgi:hypothetical protein